MESQSDSKYRREIYDKRYTDSERLMFTFGAHDWIAQNRIAFGSGRLDISATAEQLDLNVQYFNYRELGGVKGQASFKEKQIKLVLDTDSAEQIETFGHEVGHFFMHHHMGHDENPVSGHRREDENFCEVFAEEMAMPKRHLEEIGPVVERTISRLMSDYDTELQLTIHQLMRAQKLPRKILILTATDHAPNPSYNHKEVVVPICLCCHFGLNPTYGACEPPSPKTPIFDFRDLIGVEGYISICGGTQRRIIEYGLPITSNQLGSAFEKTIS
jgi:hypothetical protein